MRKVLASILAVFLLSGALFFPMRAKAETKVPKRVINVVYDDSGSMIFTNDQKVDTWCQAKYAMEVFASLLGEQDDMNVYVMSDFCKNSNADPFLRLKGADGAEANVKKVHKMVTDASDTPFDAVRKAYTDLTTESADDKWLVVLTDGEFQNGENVNSFFAKKQDDVKVLFLGMGPDAPSIQTNSSKNIYFEKAENNNDILNKITDISRHIFGFDKLNVNANKLEFSFDVPMKELIVFAQGRNVEIRALVGPNTELYNAEKTPVAVKYSEVPTTNNNENYKNPLIARDLSGGIATYKGDFPSGNYRINVKGADTLEIYYKPNVELDAYLIDSGGTEIRSGTTVNDGKYTLGFGFVKAGTKEKVSESYLLGIVSYEVMVTNNDKTEEKSYSTGYGVTLEPGDFHADVTTNYLTYNTISTSLDFKVMSDAGLELAVIESPQYVVKSNGFENASSPIAVQALFNGLELTEDQWELLDVFDVSFTGGNSKHIGKPRAEKTETPGILNIYPNFGTDSPGFGEYQSEPIKITCSSSTGGAVWKGSTTGTVNIRDDRSIFHKDPNIIIMIGVGVVVVLAGLVFITFASKNKRRRKRRRRF